MPGEPQHHPPRTDEHVLLPTVVHEAVLVDMPGSGDRRPRRRTLTSGKAMSIWYGPCGCPSTHPVIPAPRRSRRSTRSAAESARSAAAISSLPMSPTRDIPVPGSRRRRRRRTARGAEARGRGTPNRRAERPRFPTPQVRGPRCAGPARPRRPRPPGRAVQPHAGTGTRPGPGRYRDVDQGRRTGEHPVPLRGGGPGDGGALARPQPRRPHPRLVRQSVAADQDDARMQPPPSALPHPAAHAVGRVAVPAA